MKLKELMKLIDPYQDLQIFNAMTGEYYTDVIYVAGGSPINMEGLDSHLDDIVHGISAGISYEGVPYLRIAIDVVL